MRTGPGAAQGGQPVSHNGSGEKIPGYIVTMHVPLLPAPAKPLTCKWFPEVTLLPLCSTFLQITVCSPLLQSPDLFMVPSWTCPLTRDWPGDRGPSAASLGCCAHSAMSPQLEPSLLDILHAWLPSGQSSEDRTHLSFSLCENNFEICVPWLVK